MLVTKVFVRFFRSFNYDYERKAIESAERPEWELIDGVFYPFVRIPLEPSVTAVVGANESGKSHLIEAIKFALLGEKIDRGDFCRYSKLFDVESGARRKPDFVLEVKLETEDDVSGLPPGDAPFDIGSRFKLIRLGSGSNLFIGSKGKAGRLSKADLQKIQTRLPKPFELETNVPLPDSISFDDLLNRKPSPLTDRKTRHGLVEFFRGATKLDSDFLSEKSEQIKAIVDGDGQPSVNSQEKEEQSRKLAKDLLLKVANIDPSAFEDLERELRDGSEGKVGGLIAKMNLALSRHLNFGRWWRQDQDFKLQLEPRERELVFTIGDRTGTNYSFGERSRGLSYFLSYFVQLQTYRQASAAAGPGAGAEVLLMDEPDAYLSSVGQQDLLRALEDFASSGRSGRSAQVVYVTHSPFLINKNAAHRIRVLDKGTDSEGTRVVKDVSRNHYEPLRSSIGSYVAETAFIGGSNLLVEGISDQILLSALTSLLRHREVPRPRLLDMNETTIVPAGSAAGVPYMAYLARGRDELKPPCVALLDGDDEGLAAVERIADGDGVRDKAILDSRFVVEIGTWSKGVDLQVPLGCASIEPEDLIPPAIAVEAARNYAVAILRQTPEGVKAFGSAGLLDRLSGSAEGHMWRALKAEFAAVFDGARIEKAGFAKEVAAFVEVARNAPTRPEGLLALEHNFGLLIAELARLLSLAEAEEIARRSNRRSDRIVKAFLGDYPESVTRDVAFGVLQEIESSLDNTAGDDKVRGVIGDMRRRFRLGKDPLDPVPDFEAFRDRLADLSAIRRGAYRSSGDSDRESRMAASD